MPERTVMVAIIVTDPRLGQYLVDQFKFAGSMSGDNFRFLIPPKFLEILPDDGWQTELAS